MPRDPAPTRTKLLDAAELLFATRGLGVSLDEINRAAGQRNAASVQYHFTNKAGLLRAVIDRHRTGGTTRRDQLVAVARAEPEDLRLLAAAIVLPTSEYLKQGPHGCAFLRILAAILSDASRPQTDASDFLNDPRHSAIVDVLMIHSDLDRPLALERVSLLSSMVLHVCADRARITLSPDQGRPRIGYERFVANLLDISAAGLAAPTTASTGNRKSRAN
jgi:AcrR family transcriptional regulator